MKTSQTCKIVVYVPEAQADAVREAMGNAGAGRIGNYAFCFFTSKGVGRYTPLEGARPAVGGIGKLETVEEERIETICSEQKLTDVLAAIRKAHPYEKPAVDIFLIETLEYT